MRLQFESLEDQILWHVVRELSDSRDGVSIPYLVQTLSDLGPQAVTRVIEQLQRDRVVTKDELLEHLWPGEFVSESVLPRCITAARKALDDDAARQHVIQTVHSRGYRFVAVIEPLDAPAADSVNARRP